MNESQMWEDEKPITKHGIEVPDWIDQDISPSTVAAICQGGCSSGAYMPAVTYHQAAQTMNEHGDDVLEHIEDQTGETLTLQRGMSWSQLACYYLSIAVELWASGAYDQLEEEEEEE